MMCDTRGVLSIYEQGKCVRELSNEYCSKLTGNNEG